jgi:hypothetical protein
MADFCDAVFRDEKLKDLKLRYFDPTRSAAVGHEDKGLIECLMVKCAKVLVYNAGTSDSFGKAAEASMALSLGKPTIFFCDLETRRKFYRDIHPLTRLINFETGVAVGAIVTDTKAEIEALAASIKANGLLQNLIIEPEHDKKGRATGYYLVTAGEGRRLAQLLRAKRKEIAKTAPIRCVVDTEHSAEEVSLTGNTVRSDMHPADQYEAFAKLHNEQGLAAEDSDTWYCTLNEYVADPVQV